MSDSAKKDTLPLLPQSTFGFKLKLNAATHTLTAQMRGKLACEKAAKAMGKHEILTQSQEYEKGEADYRQQIADTVALALPSLLAKDEALTPERVEQQMGIVIDGFVRRYRAVAPVHKLLQDDSIEPVSFKEWCADTFPTYDTDDLLALLDGYHISEADFLGEYVKQAQAVRLGNLKK
jgi:hypothetical protein